MTGYRTPATCYIDRRSNITNGFMDLASRLLLLTLAQPNPVVAIAFWCSTSTSFTRSEGAIGLSAADRAAAAGHVLLFPQPRSGGRPDAAQCRGDPIQQAPIARRPGPSPPTNCISLGVSACRNMAAAARLADVGGFDVVDTPDYAQLGPFIRPALQAEGLHVHTVALALHGTLSSAFRAGWPTGQDDGPHLADLEDLERLQFCGADARYAISASYAAHWEQDAMLGVHPVDPLCIAGDIEPKSPAPRTDPADLVFIGRREKWKGPDLFLDIAWWIDRSLYHRLLLIGPDGLNQIGQGSDATLAGMAQMRGVEPQMAGTWPHAEISDLFAARTLLLVPSRHDTFNLTALEAIRFGCPALVSSRAGVAGWLRTSAGTRLAHHRR